MVRKCEDSRKQVLVVVWSRCASDLRFTPLLTPKLESRLQRMLAGFRRHIADCQGHLNNRGRQTGRGRCE